MTKAATTKLAVLGAALSLILLACGSGGGGGSGGTTTLTYWTMLPPAADNPRSAAEQTIIKNFEKANPDIKVKVEFFPWNQLPQKTILAVQGGGGPDVTRVSFGQTLKYLDQKTLRPLDQYLNGSTDFLGESTVFDGKHMALVWSPVPNGILYRTDLFKKTGLPQPRTWTDLTKVLSAMTSGQTAGFGFGMKKGDNLLATFLEPYMWGSGARAFDDQGKATFDGPAGVAAFQYLLDLKARHVMPGNMSNMGANDVMEGFRAGKYAAVVESASRVSYAEEGKATKGKVGLWRFPSPDGKGSPSYMLSWSIGMTKSTKHPAAAWKLINYLTGPEADKVKASVSGELPSRASSLTADMFAKEPISKEFVQYIKDFPQSPQRYVTNQTLFGDLLTDAAQSMFLNRTPVQQALTKAARDYDNTR